MGIHRPFLGFVKPFLVTQAPNFYAIVRKAMSWGPYHIIWYFPQIFRVIDNEDYDFYEIPRKDVRLQCHITNLIAMHSLAELSILYRYDAPSTIVELHRREAITQVSLPTCSHKSRFQHAHTRKGVCWTRRGRHGIQKGSSSVAHGTTALHGNSRGLEA